MISIILVALAAVCNSIMDILRDKFEQSVFSNKNLDRRYWDAKISWQNKWHGGNRNLGEKFFGSSTFLVWTTDAWHLFKSTMVCLLMGAIVVYSPIININIFSYNLLNQILTGLVDGIILGSVWNTSFTTFYRRIWIR